MTRPLTSEMGRLQVDFYLVLLVGVWVVAAVLLAVGGVPAVLRFAREPGHRLAAALIGFWLALAALLAVGLATWAFWGIAHAA